MNASYSTTGNGSAVVENLISGGTTVMTSVYHLDGSDLRVTHYCAAQNQPRLKASRIDMAQGALDFALVDITNLRAPDAPHVVGIELRMLAPDHITLTFLFEAAGKRSRERIDLKRTVRKISEGFPSSGGHWWRVSRSPGISEKSAVLSVHKSA